MEKKKIIALLAFMLIAAASSASATTTTTDPGGGYSGVKGTSGTIQMGKLSTNVTLIINYDTTSYAASAKHLSGNKEYGGGSSDTRIYVKDLAVGTASPDAPSASDSSAFTGDTNWSSL
jgi:hypothetical protein